MKLVGLWAQVVVVVLVLFMSTCPPASPRLPLYGCGRTFTYEVDLRFSWEEKKAIKASLAAWSDATSGFLCFEEGGDDFKIACADDPVRVSKIDVAAARQGTPGRPVGFASEGVAWILTDRIPDYEIFAVSVHEMGHLLGLKHYEGAESSWMHPSIEEDPGWDVYRVTPFDAITVCRIYGCVANVLP